MPRCAPPRDRSRRARRSARRARAQAAAPGWSTPHTATAVTGRHLRAPARTARACSCSATAARRRAPRSCGRSSPTRRRARRWGSTPAAPGSTAPASRSTRAAARRRLDARHRGRRTDRPRRRRWARARRCRGPRPCSRPTAGRRRCRDRRSTRRQRRRRLDPEPSGRARARDRQGRDAAIRPGAAGRDPRHARDASLAVPRRSVSTTTGNPMVTWAVAPADGTAGLIGVARGDGTGHVLPGVREQIGDRPRSTSCRRSSRATAGCSRSGSRARLPSARCT